MVVPAGRMLSNGTIILPPETLIKGVSWKTKDFQVYDDGLIEQDGDRYRGLVAFGTVDSHNIFHLLPSTINWRSLRANKTREAKNGETPIIETDGKPIFVPTETLDELFKNAVEEHSLTLIQVARPSFGPPIILPIGALLEDGNILLNDGMEIRGQYIYNFNPCLRPFCFSRVFSPNFFVIIRKKILIQDFVFIFLNF